jgi:DNA-directed RNA polymerase subunit N (RpoN/RPB10)
MLGDQPGVSRDELLNEWQQRAPLGDSYEEVADRLGMARYTFKRALMRARRAGDPRAVPSTNRRRSRRKRPAGGAQ